MEVLYFGKYGDDHVLQEKLKKKLPYFVAQYSYEESVVTELKKDDKFNVELVSIYQTEYYPEDKLLVNKQNSQFYYIPFINIPFLREISYFLNTLLIILKWAKKTDNKNRVIFSSTHFTPTSLGVVLISKLLKINKIVTFTDLSIFTYSDNKIDKMPWYKKVVMKYYKKMTNWLQTSYDGYILFSKQMDEIVNPYKKPICVIEGIYNPTKANVLEYEKKKDSDTFTILHAGTLNREYGIGKILDVFKNIDSETIQLILIGNGDMVDEINSAAENDSRIKYLDFMPKEDVFKYLKAADLLVNLRNSNDIYTVYSFPSKMFEYMASGTPVLTTKIEGIPAEYYEYIFSIDSYDTDRIANKIKNIISYSNEYLDEVGCLARDFIIENKTQVDQVNRIKEFILDWDG